MNPRSSQTPVVARIAALAILLVAGGGLTASSAFAQVVPENAFAAPAGTALAYRRAGISAQVDTLEMDPSNPGLSGSGCDRTGIMSDRDEDCLDDVLERALVAHYFPDYWMRWDFDRRQFYGTDEFGYDTKVPFVARPLIHPFLEQCRAEFTCIEIKISLPYHWDCGDDPSESSIPATCEGADMHHGDTEGYAMLLYLTPGTPRHVAQRSISVWSLHQDYASAHQGTLTDSSSRGDYGFSKFDRAMIFVAEGKHGAYHSLHDCDEGGLLHSDYCEKKINARTLMEVSPGGRIDLQNMLNVYDEAHRDDNRHKIPWPVARMDEHRLTGNWYYVWGNQHFGQASIMKEKLNWEIPWVSVTPPGPDLKIQALNWPRYASRGELATFTYNVTNGGTAEGAPAGYLNRLYVDGQIVDNNEGQIGTREGIALGPGASDTNSFAWRATCGIHTIQVMTDIGGAVAEFDENNNTSPTHTLYVVCPPSVELSPPSPLKTYYDGSEQVTFTVASYGGAVQGFSWHFSAYYGAGYRLVSGCMSGPVNLDNAKTCTIRLTGGVALHDSAPRGKLSALIDVKKVRVDLWGEDANGNFLVSDSYTLNYRQPQPCSPNPCDLSAFTDVPPEHPYFEEIEWLYENGYVSGTRVEGEQRWFSPEDELSRAMMSVLLVRAQRPEQQGYIPGAPEY